MIWQGFNGANASWLRRLALGAPMLVGLCVAAILLLGPSAGVSSAASPTGLPGTISVSVGYADSEHTSTAYFPTPWDGSSGVNFIGDPTGSIFDSGAVMVTNSGSTAVTLSNVTVSLEGQTFNANGNLWGTNLTVPAGGSLVLAQVGGIYSFDTSDVNNESCSPTSAEAVIDLNYGGSDYDFQDTNQVLNTGGIDPGNCSANGSEGHAWQSISEIFGVTASSLAGITNPAMPNMTNVEAAEPVNVATGNYTINKTDLALPGLGLSLSATRSYNSVLSSTNGPLGYGWTGSYMDSLTVNTSGATTGYVTLNEANGSTAIWNKTANGLVPAQPGILAKLVENSSGTYTLTLPDQTTETFSTAGVLQSESDSNGYTTSLAYNSSGQLSTVTDPEGRAFTYTWTGSHITGIADGQGRSVAYGYDSAGDLTSVTDVDGNVTKYAYNSSHDLTSVTDPDGNVLTNVYNAVSQVSQQTDPDGNITGFAYKTGSTSVTLPDGTQTQYAFNSSLLPTSITRAFGTPYAATSTYTYDANDNLASITQPDGETTTNTWDSDGNLLSSTNGAGNTTKYTYNPFNEATSSTNANGIKTTYSYDSNGNLTGTSTPVGDGTNRVSSIAYTNGMPGVISTYTDPDGHVWTLQHDKYGQTTAVIDPEGNKKTTAYNSVGQVIATVDPRGNVSGANPATYTTTYKYLPSGLVTQATSPDGSVVSYAYNGDGQRITQTDPDGNITKYSYDPDGHLTSTKLPDGSTQQTTYTPTGLKASQIDAAGDTTSFSYNALDLLATKTLPDGEQWSYSYNGDGQLASSLDPEDQTTNYSYNGAGQITAEKFSNSSTTPNESFNYDPDGQLTSMTDGTGTSSFTYDNVGELLSETTGSGTTISYAYDHAGNVTDIVYPKGLISLTDTNGTPITGNGTVQRAYTADGQLASVTDWLGNKTTFAYDAAGNLTNTSYANGVTETRTYDPDGLLTQLTDLNSHGTTLLNLPYKYNADDEITQTGLQSGTTPQTSQQYGYSSLNQLTSSTQSVVGQPLATTNYSYDAAERLTSATLGGVGSKLSYNADSELTKLTSPTLNTTTNTYGYDADGDRVSNTNSLTGTTSNYAYNQLGELIGYRGPAINLANGQTGQDIATTSYTYNGMGLRSDLTWDIAGGIPLVIGTSTAAYITGPDGLPLEQISPANTVLYYQHDQLGSTRLLTTQSGLVAAQYAYDAYGNQVGSRVNSVVNPFMFDGQYSDTTDGLVYMRARYYDPSTGQFISQDPLESTTLQPYGFADDDPTNVTDPTGLCGILDDFNPFSSCNFAYQGASAITNGNPGLLLAGISLFTGFGDLADLALFPDIYSGLSALSGGLGEVADINDCEAGDTPSCFGAFFGGPAFLGAFGDYLFESDLLALDLGFYGDDFADTLGYYGLGFGSVGFGTDLGSAFGTDQGSSLDSAGGTSGSPPATGEEDLCGSSA